MNEPENGDPGLILPFTAIDRGALAVAGGKAANLGELVRAGFPVPAGFCVTTAAYDLVAADAGLGAHACRAGRDATRGHGASGWARQGGEILPLGCKRSRLYRTGYR